MGSGKILLALETSGKSGSVAVLRTASGVCLCSTEQLASDSGSAKTLAPAIERLLAKESIDIQSLDAIALLTGPGSFTGLRVGVATAKALAYALQIPVVEVDTLDTIAWQCLDTRSSIFAVFDAYRGQVFCAEFETKGRPASQEIHRFTKKSPTEILDIDPLLERASRSGSSASISFCGPGCSRIKKHLDEISVDHRADRTQWLDRIEWLDGPETYPVAESVARLGYVKFMDGECTDAFRVQPRYYRESAAEELAVSKKKP